MHPSLRKELTVPVIVSVLLVGTAALMAFSFGSAVKSGDDVDHLSGDPQGLTVYLMALTTVVIACLTAIQLREQAEDLPVWWNVLFTVGISIGVAVTLYIGLDAAGNVLPLSLPTVPVALALVGFSCGMLFALAVELFDRWGTLPTWLLLLAMTQPAAGENASTVMERFAYWFPPGAGIAAVRDTLYFDGASVDTPLKILLAWSVITMLAFAWFRYHPVDHRRTKRRRAKR
ncbi:hypothetical protein [Haloglycomyces albus]|uniref:hypothetical protein n=1 Tax=Haloglycomyces albus TaxID=526067 RepID=UPI00046D29B9|nr:hypothetical protein [Haloglycomyces albus]